MDFWLIDIVYLTRLKNYYHYMIETYFEREVDKIGSRQIKTHLGSL